MLEEIEASLQRSWDRETLTVYADVLQAMDDPRGTLIALALAGTPDVPRIQERRRAACEAWLGPFAAEAAWLGGETGFVSLTVRSRATAEAFLGSHLAGYLRRLSVDAATPEESLEILVALATRRHPWCAVIELALPSAATPVPEAITDAFFAAMPHASALKLRGPRRVAAIPDTIRALDVAGDAFVSRAPTRVEAITATASWPLQADELARWLEPARFPRLARLDLAARRTDAFAIFEAMPPAAGLAWLRLPALRDEAEAAHLRAIRARLPDLEIELGVLHRPRAHLLDEALDVRTPTVVPCAPQEAYAMDDYFVITFPGAGLRFQAHTAGLASNTETFFTKFSSEQQAALVLLWSQLERLGSTPIGVPGAALTRVCETMMLTDFDTQFELSGWDVVARAFASQPCSVQISRPVQARTGMLRRLARWLRGG